VKGRKRSDERDASRGKPRRFQRPEILHLPSDHLGSHRGDDGRIAENWHIEDNLTLLQQLGQIAK